VLAVTRRRRGATEHRESRARVARVERVERVEPVAVRSRMR
jgi:hypothetical protein